MIVLVLLYIIIPPTLVGVVVLLYRRYRSRISNNMISSCEASYNCSPGRTIELINSISKNTVIFGNIQEGFVKEGFFKGPSLCYFWKNIENSTNIAIIIKENSAFIKIFGNNISKDDGEKLCSFISKILELTIK